MDNNLEQAGMNSIGSQVEKALQAPAVPSPILKPYFILLTTVLPLSVMILLMLKDYCLVASQMTSTNCRAFFLMIGLTLLSIGTGLAFWAIYRKRGHLTVMPLLVMLVVDLVGVIVPVCLFDQMLPDVEWFILSPITWFVDLFTFYMPGFAFGIIALTESFHGGKTFWISLVAVIGIPVLVYATTMFFVILDKVFGSRMNFDSPEWLDMLIGMTLTFSLLCGILVVGLLFYFAIVKVLVSLIRIMAKMKYFRLVTSLLVGIFLPILGLMLNVVIPFPSDLQRVPVYILTIVNGALLLCGVTNKRWLDYGLCFLKGATYWFALYFFILFQPFLPLFVPAIFASGAGVLILTPALLFVFQNYLLAVDWHQLAARYSRKGICIAFAMGLLASPLVFLLNAVADRVALDRLVSFYFHSPRIMSMDSQVQAFKSGASGRALRQFAATDAGIPVPIIGDVYRAIVYSGLELSKSTRLQLQYDLGSKGSSFSVGELFNNSGMYMRPIRLHPNSGFQSAVPDNSSTPQAFVTQLSAEPLPDGAGARVRLEISSESPLGAEYSGRITLPDGVLAAGMTLDIDGEQVPGRFFERKSAAWIYEKIVSARRDPAILRYLSNGCLSLRVFPVNESEPRVVTIDLLYPSGDAPSIQIDDRKLALPSATAPSAWRFISPEQLRGMDGLSGRRPELVFIVDRTAPEEQIVEGIHQILERFPEADSFRLVSGIVAAGDMTDSIARDRLAELPDFIQTTCRPGKNGFAPLNVTKGAIVQAVTGTNRLSPEHYPVFVLLTGKKLNRGMELNHYEPFAPEYPWLVTVYLSKDASDAPEVGSLEFRNLTLCPTPSPRAAKQLPDGRVVAVASGAVLQTGRRADGRYDQARDIFERAQRLIIEPETEKEVLPKLIAESKAAGLLIPQNSCLVLETEAQWKKLEEVEKTKLSRSSAFDIEETTASEPAAWLLLAFLLLLVLIHRLVIARKRG